MAQPAGNPADDGVAEAKDAVGDPAGVHQLSGQQEKGDRHEHKAVSRIDHLLGQGVEGEVGEAVVHHQHDHAYRTDGVWDAEPQTEQQDQQHDKDKKF